MTGFAGLLRGELGRWLGRRGLLHLVVWTAIVQGQLYVATTTAWPAYDSFWGFDLVVHLLWVFPTLGAIAVAQGAIAEERVWDTAGWVLAQPVARPAFVAAKVLGTALPLIVLSIWVQAGLALWWLPDVEPDRGLAAPAPDTGRYLVVLGILSLLLLSFVTLAIAVDTLLRQRAVTAGVSLVVFTLFVSPPGQRTDAWHEWFPGGLVEGLDNSAGYKRVGEYLLGGSLEGTAAIGVSAAAILGLTGFAMWRFSREEL